MSARVKKPLFRTLLYVLLYGLAALWIMPFLWILRSSLMDFAQIFRYPPQFIPDPVRWENYPDALTALPFASYFVNTFTLVIANVAGMLVSTSLSAYGLSRVKWRGRELVFGIIMTSVMLPYFATLIPSFLIWKSIGLTNTYIPLILPTWFCVQAGTVFGGGMFNIFLLRQFFRGIPRELDEAAIVDGAGHFRIFTGIILPLARPAMICVGLFTFLNTWNDFLSPLIYLNGEENYTLQLGLRSFISMFAAQWHLLMAASAVIVIPVVILFLIGQRYFIEGIATSGLKG